MKAGSVRERPPESPASDPGQWAALGVLAGGVAAVGFAAIFVRLSHEAPPLSEAAYRMLIGAAALGGFAGVQWRRGRDSAPARAAWPLLLISGLLLAGHFWAWFASLDRTSVGSSVVIVAMQPLLAGLLGIVFLRESPSANEYAGIGLAAVGLVIIGGRDLIAGGSTEIAGDALALLGALLAAGYLTVGRRVRAELSTTMYSGVVYSVAAIVLWLLVAVLQPRIGGFGLSTWGYLALLALVPQVAGHTALNWSLGRYRAVTVSLAIIGEPVVATLLAIPILGEYPTAGVLIGAPFILAGIVVGLAPGARAGVAAEAATVE